MSKKESKKDKTTRYSNSVVDYKSLSCKVSLYEDRLITEYCLKNKISKSLFLATAAIYCVKNNISSKDLLNSTTTSETFDYKDYKEDEYDE